MSNTSALPDFCYDPNRTLTFSDSKELIAAASQWWNPKKKAAYVVKPILTRIASLAIEKPKDVPTPPPEPKVVIKKVAPPLWTPPPPPVFKRPIIIKKVIRRRAKPEVSPPKQKRKPCGCLIGLAKSTLPKIFHKLSARKQRL